MKRKKFIIILSASTLPVKCFVIKKLILLGDDFERYSFDFLYNVVKLNNMNKKLLAIKSKEALCNGMKNELGISERGKTSATLLMPTIITKNMTAIEIKKMTSEEIEDIIKANKLEIITKNKDLNVIKKLVIKKLGF